MQARILCGWIESYSDEGFEGAGGSSAPWKKRQLAE